MTEGKPEDKKDKTEKIKRDATLLDVTKYILRCRVKHTLLLITTILSLYYTTSGRLQWDSLSDILRLSAEKMNLFENKSSPVECNRRLRFKRYVYDSQYDNAGEANQVLYNMGYVREWESNGTDWDIFLSRTYPFDIVPEKRELKNALPHQRINHIPGIHHLTHKGSFIKGLSNHKFLLPTFRMTEHKQQLLDFIAEYPDKVLVQKSIYHYGTKIMKVKDMNLDGSLVLVQEYLQKPLLVEGHKCDIGVYVVITSIDPLRIYVYNSEVFLRFCNEKYYPFDESKIGKYLCNEYYVPTLFDYLVNKLNYTRKDVLNAYVKSVGVNPAPLWNKMEHIIRTVILEKEMSILEEAAKYKSKKSFFELLRFDFIITEDLNVYLLDVNTSPNIFKHHSPQRTMQTEIYKNVFGLLGLGARAVYYQHDKNELQFVPDMKLAVYPDVQMGNSCKNSCRGKCQIHVHCLTPDTKLNLARSYLEHINKGDCKRIFPPTLDPDNNDTVRKEILQRFSPQNRYQYLWFLGKCQMDRTWC